MQSIKSQFGRKTLNLCMYSQRSNPLWVSIWIDSDMTNRYVIWEKDSQYTHVTVTGGELNIWWEM